MRKFSSLMCAGLVLVLVLSLFGGALAAPAGERVEVLIGFHGQPNPGLVRAFGGDVLYEFSLIPTIHAMLPAQAAAALSRHPSVRYMEPNGEVWALGQETPWGVTRVGANITWSRSTGHGVGVAVLDTGIFSGHPDLNGRVATAGKNTIDDTSPFSDGHGHGTHVAGTIAAVDNDIGVVGVAHEATLYAVKVLDDSGAGSWASVATGIEWAAGQSQVRVINMSLGGSSSSTTLEDACNAAYAEGVLLVAAAGNSGNRRGTGDNVGYPARYSSVIAVAASDSSNKRASFSSTGLDVELIAPGVSIKSTVPTDSYATWSGTSMASPHVAGVAALVWAAESDLTAVAVRTRLQETAQDLGLSASHQGYGLVRADLAVAAEPLVTYDIQVQAEPDDGGTVGGGGTCAQGTTATVTASANEGYVLSGWFEGSTKVSTSNSYSFAVTSDRTLVAGFDKAPNTPPASYTVAVSTSPSYGGTASGGGTFSEGEQVTVTATAAGDYEFVNWMEGQEVVSTDAAYSFELTDNRDLVANFRLIPAGAVVSVGSITYSTTGGRFNDRHLHVTVALADGAANPVAGASVSITLSHNGSAYATSTGTTASTGTVTFSYNSAPSGTYTTTVTGVTATGLTWDKITPENSFLK